MKWLFDSMNKLVGTYEFLEGNLLQPTLHNSSEHGDADTIQADMVVMSPLLLGDNLGSLDLFSVASCLVLDGNR